MNHTITVATKSDVSSVIHLLKEVAGWLKENEINQWSFLLAGGEDNEIKQDIVEGNTYIVSTETEIIATFTLLPTQSEWDLHIWGDDNELDSLYLHRLAVKPSYMKNGLGANILHWIQENVKPRLTLLKLDCVADNHKLNSFYKNNGFTHIGTTLDGHSKYIKDI
ncbi:GNAT family N-acetyltransferase [Fredinandcohnia humi]